MEIFSALFNSTETVNKVTDAVIDAGDAMFLTDEEEIQYNHKKLAMKMEWMKLYEPFKVAQRYIALIISIPYVSAWFIIFIATLANQDTSKAALLLDGNLGLAFVLVVGFYFAAGAGEGLINKWKNKS